MQADGRFGKHLSLSVAATMIACVPDSSTPDTRPHRGVDGELPPGDLRQQERSGLDQVRAQVWGAVDLGADDELDPPGREANTRGRRRSIERGSALASTLFGESSSCDFPDFPVRNNVITLPGRGLRWRATPVTLLGWVWAGAGWSR